MLSIKGAAGDISSRAAPFSMIGKGRGDKVEYANPKIKAFGNEIRTKQRADLLAFSPKKAAYIKALRAQFGGGWYLSMGYPCFGLQSVTFQAAASIMPLETRLI